MENQNNQEIGSKKEELIVNAIVENLQQSGLNYVYILPSTGRYEGKKYLTEFAVWYRTDCYYLGSDRDNDFLGHLKNDLIKTMIGCLKNGIHLEDAKYIPLKISFKNK